MLVLKIIIGKIIRHFEIVNKQTRIRSGAGFHLINEGGYHIMLNKR